MIFTQVLTDIYVFPLNSRFRSFRCSLNLGFNGCLLLDPLRFISCHLLVIERWVKEIRFYCLDPLLLSEYHFQRIVVLGQFL